LPIEDGNASSQEEVGDTEQAAAAGGWIHDGDEDTSANAALTRARRRVKPRAIIAAVALLAVAGNGTAVILTQTGGGTKVVTGADGPDSTTVRRPRPPRQR
jgi:hypothetical protein